MYCGHTCEWLTYGIWLISIRQINTLWQWIIFISYFINKCWTTVVVHTWPEILRLLMAGTITIREIVEHSIWLGKEERRDSVWLWPYTLVNQISVYIYTYPDHVIQIYINVCKQACKMQNWMYRYLFDTFFCHSVFPVLVQSIQKRFLYESMF